MKRWTFAIALVSVVGWSAPTVLGFCGFYVAKADTKLFNKASQVILVRDGDRTVMTMANDFKGDLTEFAVVIPVPTFLQRPAVAVWIAKVGERLIVAALRMRSALPLAILEMPDLADLHPSLNKLSACGLDVRDHQVSALDGPRWHGGEPEPDRDRAG